MDARRPAERPEEVADARRRTVEIGMARRQQNPLVCHGHSRPIVEINYR